MSDLKSIIKPIRRCRSCEHCVGKVNGDFVHTTGHYVCHRGQKSTVAE